MYYNYGKVVNGELQIAEKYMQFGNGVGVLYPSDALLLENGYKPINYNHQEEAPEGYHWESSVWEETESECRLIWDLVEDPVPSDDDEIDTYDAAGIILGGGLQ